MRQTLIFADYLQTIRATMFSVYLPYCTSMFLSSSGLFNSSILEHAVYKHIFYKCEFIPRILIWFCFCVQVNVPPSHVHGSLLFVFLLYFSRNINNKPVYLFVVFEPYVGYTEIFVWLTLSTSLFLLFLHFRMSLCSLFYCVVCIYFVYFSLWYLKVLLEGKFSIL